jgi:nanoRNase/pAp phosphatase (c-di-AMP/oligoRNAs hydrolase)
MKKQRGGPGRGQGRKPIKEGQDTVTVSFSLRSSDDGEDVAEVAKQYGGGGHRNASGFTVSFAQAQAFEV